MTETSTDIELSPALLKQFADMVTVIPDFEPGGGEQIYAAILTAGTIEDLESPWQGGRQLPTNRPVIVEGIAKAPSDFGAGLPFYLVLDCIELHSSERKEYVTGSTSIVAQLVRAYTLGAFPIRCMAVEADKVSRNGYRPQHLTEISSVVGEGGPKRGK